MPMGQVRAAITEGRRLPKPEGGRQIRGDRNCDARRPPRSCRRPGRAWWELCAPTADRPAARPSSGRRPQRAARPSQREVRPRGGAGGVGSASRGTIPRKNRLGFAQGRRGQGVRVWPATAQTPPPQNVLSGTGNGRSTWRVAAGFFRQGSRSRTRRPPRTWTPG